MKILTTKTLSLGDINPFVRIIRAHTIESGFQTPLRYNHHYQLHYLLQGEGEFYINGETHHAVQGDVCFWEPGVAHTISTPYNTSMRVIGVQFDFTREFSQLNYLLIPYNKADFLLTPVHEKVSFNSFSGFPSHTSIINQTNVDAILTQAAHYYNSKSVYSEQKSSAKLKEFFMILAEQLSVSISSSSAAHHQHILAYIHSHFHEALTNNALATKFGYHPVHLNRIILSLTGLSLHQYIIKLRIDESLHLLQTTSLPIYDIANKLGYDNPNYFSHLFKLKTGYSPSYFRN